MEEWKEVQMSDIIEEISMGPFGSDIKRECYVDDGIPYLNGSNVQGIKLGEKSFIYVSEEKANSLKKSIAHRGDLIVTHRGTLGQIVYVPDDSKYSEYLISNSQFRITLKKAIVSPVFLAYYFHSREGQNKILANSSQVGVPALGRPTSTFRKITINIPSLQKQNKIVSILKSLDDKIENNRKINENLEQQAQALFKSWFVDFEPFRGQPFVESELGMIPEGWRVGSIYEIIDVIYGSPFQSSKFNSEGKGHPLIRIRDLKTFSPQFYTDEIIPNMEYVQYGDVVAGMDAEFVPVIWRGETGVLNQRVCKFKSKTKSISNYYIINVLRPKLEYVQSYKTGTTVSHLGKSDIDTFKIIAPPSDIILKYSDIVNPMLDEVITRSKESLRLSHLRDTLLPKLMSGEIKL